MGSRRSPSCFLWDIRWFYLDVCILEGISGSDYRWQQYGICHTRPGDTSATGCIHHGYTCPRDSSAPGETRSDDPDACHTSPGDSIAQVHANPAEHFQSFTGYSRPFRESSLGRESTRQRRGRSSGRSFVQVAPFR